MTDDQFIEIKYAVVALITEMMKHHDVGFLWDHSPYKELKWVQHHPVLYGVECALKRIGKLLKKKDRDEILRELGNERLTRLWAKP
jgi:hypothetical protein